MTLGAWTPDPTFYASPPLVAEGAVEEELAYVVTLNTGVDGGAKPDALTVEDRDAAWEGKRCRWVAAWSLPCGRFAGQLAWVPRQYAQDPRLHVLGWVPTEDLIDIVPDGTIDPEV